MQKRIISYALLAASTASSAIIKDVRDAIARKDFGQAEAHVEAYRSRNGVTSEMLEAQSWLARGALAQKDYSKAETFARKTHEMCVEQLKLGPLDRDRYLPIALGASIEVMANVLGARGERSAAVDLLNREIKTYYTTSIRTRLQKNLNLLTLEGKPAPAIPVDRFAGAKPPSLAQLKGKPVLIFFWAHWCGDCKKEVPILARLEQEYGDRLGILAPTQRYGYAAQGEPASPEAELKYIDEIRQKYYAARISNFPVPVSEEAFKNYGASTTPTIVIVDAGGVVRLYHPGDMTYEELKARLPY